MRLQDGVMEKFSRLKHQWALRKRLEFIDFWLYWEGSVTKPKVASYFQATDNTIRKTFEMYRKDFEGRMELNKAGNRWMASVDFQPILIEPDADEYLYYLVGKRDALELVFNHADRIESNDLIYFTPLIVRRRAIKPECLRNLFHAIRNELEIAIEYSSPNDAEVKELWVAPHGILHDGFRWSCRAYRYDYERYGELVLDRVISTGGTREIGEHSSATDSAWQNEFDVAIGPNPGLDAAARRHIEEQYAMESGSVSIPVKECAIPYFLKRYQIEEKSQNKAPNQEPIVVANREEVTSKISPRMRVPPE